MYTVAVCVATRLLSRTDESDSVCTSCSTWRDGHVVLFRVAPSHGAHAVEAVGCDDRVGLG